MIEGKLLDVRKTLNNIPADILTMMIEFAFLFWFVVRGKLLTRNIITIIVVSATFTFNALPK